MSTISRNALECYFLAPKDYKNPFYIEKNVNERYACLLNGPRSPGMDLVLQY